MPIEQEGNGPDSSPKTSEVAAFAGAFLSERSPTVLIIVVWICISIAMLTTRDMDHSLRWLLAIFAVWATARVLVGVNEAARRSRVRSLVEVLFLL
jgi:hypothetical protein